MEQALVFFREFELWIYALLALGALIYIRKFVLAWQELKGAAFGLERDNAQSRLNLAASMLVLLLTMAIAEFVLISFIAPMLPQSTPLLTPTADLLSTPTATLPVDLTSEAAPPATSGDTPETLPTDDDLTNGCVPGQVQINLPKEGDEIKGEVTITGTMDFENFGFYKIESRRPDEPVWAILLVGNRPVQSGELGKWNTSALAPGEYQLSLVPVNNEAQSLPRCTITVRVSLPDPEE